jgi:hypothetical protein
VVLFGRIRFGLLKPSRPRLSLPLRAPGYDEAFRQSLTDSVRARGLDEHRVTSMERLFVKSDIGRQDLDLTSRARLSLLLFHLVRP